MMPKGIPNNKKKRTYNRKQQTNITGLLLTNTGTIDMIINLLKQIKKNQIKGVK